VPSPLLTLDDNGKNGKKNSTKKQEQYVMPTIRNSVAAVRARSAAGVAERVLKLALPSTYSWAVMFVTLFDCYLTLLAEATRFADRAFFADWWNARTVGQYWRTWNLPVHRFLLRHVFNPLRRRGLGRVPSMTLVFAVSAALHELAVAVPLHLFRPPWRLYAFWGVLLQVPLVLLTEPLAASGAGNYVFWVTFCAVGQPIGMILYFCDWVSAAGK
jgi:diacylglycerol O-acyltransferase-1